MSVPPQKRERISSTSSAAIDKKSYTGKVDIFQDSKVYNVEKFPSDVPLPLSLEQVVNKPLLLSKSSYPIEKPRDAPIPSSKGIGAHRTYEPVGARAAISSSSSSTAASKVDQAYTEMEYLQTELEWFRLGGNTANGQTSSGDNRTIFCLVASNRKLS